jgi:hypothetical protein
MSSTLQPDLDSCHLDFIWKTHEYINNYVRFADQKAVFVVAWCSAIIGAIYAAHLNEGVLHSHITLAELSWGTTLAGFALVMMGLSFLTAAWVVVPRLPTNQRSGLIFWESILVHADGELFANAMGRFDQNQLARHLSVQVYTLAGVAKTKYWWLAISMWFAFFGSICGVSAILVHG